MTARLFRLFWLMVLVSQTILAILWWIVQPGGFPVGHPRFWSNSVAPIVALAFANLRDAGRNLGGSGLGLRGARFGDVPESHPLREDGGFRDD